MAKQTLHLANKEDVDKLKNPEFEVSENRTNIKSGEDNTSILGKIMKFFTDLKAHAFNDTANNLTTTEEGYALDARQGKQLLEYMSGIYGSYGKVLHSEVEIAVDVGTSKTVSLNSNLSDFNTIEFDAFLTNNYHFNTIRIPRDKLEECGAVLMNLEDPTGNGTTGYLTFDVTIISSTSFKYRIVTRSWENGLVLSIRARGLQ